MAYVARKSLLKVASHVKLAKSPSIFSRELSSVLQEGEGTHTQQGFWRRTPAEEPRNLQRTGCRSSPS